jgi:hypothetical protein
MMSTEPNELPTLSLRGRIAPDSHLDGRDQLRLYEEQMGVEATRRQALLARQELARKVRRPRKAW